LIPVRFLAMMLCKSTEGNSDERQIGLDGGGCGVRGGGGAGGGEVDAAAGDGAARTTLRYT